MDILKERVEGGLVTDIDDVNHILSRIDCVFISLTAVKEGDLFIFDERAVLQSQTPELHITDLIQRHVDMGTLEPVGGGKYIIHFEHLKRTLLSTGYFG